MKTIHEDTICKFSMSFDEESSRLFAHIEIKEWTLETYRHLLLLRGMYGEQFKSIGIKEIYSIARTDKACKFNNLFGFYHVSDVMEKETGEIYRLMRLEC